MRNLSWCRMQCGPACSKALVCSSVCQWHSQMSPQCLQVSCDQRLTVLLGFSITKPHSDSLFPFTNNCSNRFRMILLSKLLFPKWVFMFSPTWSPFPLCLCCFLKQIIGSPIIIMYLSLKKTFSLYWGIKVRADLLCIRKLAQGVLVTLQPSPWDTGAMKCTCCQVSFTQSANPQVFHIGSKTCLEPLHGWGSLASCLGTNTEGCRVAATPGPPTVLCPPQPHPAQPPHGWQRRPHQLPEICVLLPRRLVPRHSGRWQVMKRNLFMQPQSQVLERTCTITFRVWPQAYWRVPFSSRLLRIWALELKTPIAFAPMTNGLCCTFFPHGGVIATGYVSVSWTDGWRFLLSIPCSFLRKESI